MRFISYFLCMLGTRLDEGGWRVGLQAELLRMREVPKDLGKRIAEAAGLAVLLHLETARAEGTAETSARASASAKNPVVSVETFVLPGLIGDILGERRVA
jgi:hypothetical protein